MEKIDDPGNCWKELDYTVCSVHSRFGLEETGTDGAHPSPRWTIVISTSSGHATGRLLLKRPGYELDIESNRSIVEAEERICFFEINSSPDRLDLSARECSNGPASRP